MNQSLFLDNNYPFFFRLLSFSVGFLLVLSTSLSVLVDTFTAQFPADLVTFIEEILKVKLHFLCGV